MTAYAVTLEVPDRGGQGLTAISPLPTLSDMDTIAVAAAASMEIANDGDIVAVVRNGGAATTLTVKAVVDPEGRGGGGVGDAVYSIPIGSTTPQFAFVPLMNPASFNGGGTTQLTLSSTASVTIAFLRLKKVL